jgi:hypothetical protein
MSLVRVHEAPMWTEEQREVILAACESLGFDTCTAKRLIFMLWLVRRGDYVLDSPHWQEEEVWRRYIRALLVCLHNRAATLANS